MPERLPVGHQRHGHVLVAAILHELPHFVRNLRNLCKQFFTFAFEALPPAVGGITHGGMPEDERRFELPGLVAGGDGVEVSFGKALRAALRIDELARAGDGEAKRISFGHR